MTSPQWVVLLNTGNETVVYGPIDEGETAERFADFLSNEVDPASPRMLRSPTNELLGYWAVGGKTGAAPASHRPEYWPPKPGHIWQDRNKDRWVGTGSINQRGYLVCLSRQADDSAEEIWRRYGPLTFVQSVDVTEEEAPF